MISIEDSKQNKWKMQRRLQGNTNSISPKAPKKKPIKMKSNVYENPDSLIIMGAKKDIQKLSKEHTPDLTNEAVSPPGEQSKGDEPVKM